MKYIPILACAALALTAFLIRPASSEKQKYEYIGVSECTPCHGTDAMGNQVRAWQNSAHSKAARVLRSERAVVVAKRLNIDSPTTNPECLKCHTTGGGKVEKTISEGVGCEMCHGPASMYYDIASHAPYGDKQKDYARAQSFGMYKILDIEGIKLRERMCRRCHTLDRPCMPDDPQEKKRQELALSVIADFIFAHPLRR
jgi:hypothetical protein